MVLIVAGSGGCEVVTEASVIARKAAKAQKVRRLKMFHLLRRHDVRKHGGLRNKALLESVSPIKAT